MNDRAPDDRLRRDTPVAGQQSTDVWGSDAIAAMLRDMDIPYVLLNPGIELPRAARQPRELPRQRAAADARCACTRSTPSPSPMATRKSPASRCSAIVHSNVGLMHASMAIFNAWCDRMPVILIGATGPVDAAKRRPWIDWIHTARDQAALVRGFVKWDDQPASIGRGLRIAAAGAARSRETAPKGPVYVCLDVAMQEEKLAAMPRRRTRRGIGRRPPRTPAPELVDRAAAWLAGAQRPLILMGRVSRDVASWQRARRARREAERAGLDRPEGRRGVPDRSSAARGAAAVFLDPCRGGDACAKRTW